MKHLMKSIYLPLIAMIFVLASCGNKQTAEQALQAYNDLQEQQSAFLEELESELPSITSQSEYEALVARADSAYEAMVAEAYEIAKDFSGKEVCTQVLMDLHYYFTTEQKEVLFAKYTEAQIAEDEALSKIHKAFVAEMQTKVGLMYTDFVAPQPDGTTLAVSDLVGKTDYLFIDFWASWCSPCRQSMPALKELYASLPAGRLEILGVSLDNSHDKWTNAIAEMELTWCHISDLKGWGCEGSGLYGVSAIPATVLIDREGKIVGRNLSHDELYEILK